MGLEGWLVEEAGMRAMSMKGNGKMDSSTGEAASSGEMENCMMGHFIKDRCRVKAYLLKKMGLNTKEISWKG